MTQIIEAILVDDEHHAREALATALQAHPNIKLLQKCNNGPAAIKAVHELKPQLMFLDIQMPQLDGFDVLELLGDEAPRVIFVTAYDEFALKAFDNNALDYLLKPLSPERLQTALEKAAQQLPDQQNESHSKLLDDKNRVDNNVDRVLVRDGGDVTVIAASDISHIEAAGDYVGIHQIKDGETKTHIKQSTLQQLENSLDPQQFCRIHRSYLININYLDGIVQDGKNKKLAQLKNGLQLGISRSGYQNLKQCLQ